MLELLYFDLSCQIIAVGGIKLFSFSPKIEIVDILIIGCRRPIYQRGVIGGVAPWSGKF